MPLALIIGQALVQFGPALAGQIAELLHRNTEPTLEEWHALLAKAAGKSYDDYMAEAIGKKP